MLDVFDQFREVSFLAVCIKMVAAFLCGGIIGAEREIKRRSVGFRTHILITIGAAMTTLTSQYLFLEMGYFTDVGRLGAQVIAGIGFMGAGAIIVTRKNKVKGLTTAAGLWACAIVGLSIGAGFYEGAFIVTLLIIMAETVFSRLQNVISSYSPDLNVYIEYTDSAVMEKVFRQLRQNRVKILHIEITKKGEAEEKSSSAIISLRLYKSKNSEQLIELINTIPGVGFVEEI